MRDLNCSYFKVSIVCGYDLIHDTYLATVSGLSILLTG